jgi:PIN domain nuclease of toxin-antitoxin system
VRLLLDTHALLWATGDTDRIPVGVRTLIEERRNDVFVSLVSIWEIRIKTAAGKLILDIDLLRTIKNTDLSILPITLDHVERTATLPAHHKDPFDRMLIAQARVEGMTLVTADRMIRHYDVPVLWS